MARYRAYIQSKEVYETCGFKGALRQNIKEDNLEQYIKHCQEKSQKYNQCYRIINVETKEIIYECKA